MRLVSLELGGLALVAAVVVAIATVAVVAAVATITVVVAVATLTVVAAVTAVAVVATLTIALAITLLTRAVLAAFAVVLAGLASSDGLSIVDLDGPLAELGTLELLQGVNGSLNVDEVGVGKATGPAGSTVNGDADVLETVNADEDVVQLGIGGLVGDVANEKAGGRLADGAAAVDLRTAGLNANAATVPERAVDLGAGLLEGLTGGEGDETVTVDTIC